MSVQVVSDNPCENSDSLSRDERKCEDMSISEKIKDLFINSKGYVHFIICQDAGRKNVKMNIPKLKWDFKWNTGMDTMYVMTQYFKGHSLNLTYLIIRSFVKKCNTLSF